MIPSLFIEEDDDQLYYGMWVIGFQNEREGGGGGGGALHLRVSCYWIAKSSESSASRIV